MLDRQLYILLIQTLAQLAPLRGVVDRAYLQRYQPTQQGRPDGPTIWMHKVGDKAIGTARRTHTPAVSPSGMLRREEQAMETTIQFSCTQPVDLAPDGYSHGDIIKAVRACLQSDEFISRTMPYGVSVLRVQDIRTTHYKNDLNEWEQSPTFDLVVKHTDVYLDTQPQITKFEFEIISVPNLAA